MFRYPGGKSRLLNQLEAAGILHTLSGYDRLVSPFTGGGHFEISQTNIESLWLNDKNCALYCLLDIVSEDPSILIDKIENFTPSLEDFYYFKDCVLKVKTPPALLEDRSELAFQKIVLHQCSYSGLGEMGGPLGGKEQKSRYPIDCRWSPSNLISKIKKVHNRLSKSKITNYDWREILADGKFKKTDFLFLDPPYVKKADALYLHSFTEQDHSDLMNTLKNCDVKWMLSYDDDDWVRNNYDWAKIYEISKNYKVSSKTKKVSELIIVP